MTFRPDIQPPLHLRSIADKAVVQWRGNSAVLRLTCASDASICTRPRPQGDYISNANGGNETHQKRDGQQETNMSLDNASHPVRPGPELVPSRYALRVGEIDVLVVSDGVLSLPGAMLGHNVDPAVRAAWLEDMFLPPDVLEWALNVVVVRSGDRTILVDAGMGAEFPDLPRAGRLAQRLEAAGIDLASVTDVVLTHMHMDHVGGLLADGVKERLRADLWIHVAAAETKFWESPDFAHVSMPPGFP